MILVQPNDRCPKVAVSFVSLPCVALRCRVVDLLVSCHRRIVHPLSLDIEPRLGPMVAMRADGCGVCWGMLVGPIAVAAVAVWARYRTLTPHPLCLGA